MKKSTMQNNSFVSTHNILVQIFTRTPEPGKCKTRLAKIMGDEVAAQIQSLMLDYLIKTVQESELCDLEIWFHGSKDYFSRYPKITIHEQVAGSLGDRMEFAMNKGLQEYNTTIIVGSDCVGLSQELLVQAVNLLEQNDVVIAPSNDGGYCLIGSSRPGLPMFNLSEWSHGQVFSDTMNLLRNAQLTTGILTKVLDVDTRDDLEVSLSSYKAWHDYYIKNNKLDNFTIA